MGVFPGNLNMVRLWWDKPWPMRLAAIARLPLQIPMITQAIKVYRSAKAAGNSSSAARSSGSGSDSGATVCPERT